ncbi:MAG TPA: S8 family serine peptidase [Candidatus Sulfomarinibacteraceae bacterium]|nr:S8 family serine peptidase [Candidatus Sulfomarinibacteraceae bacterium]
MKHGSITVLLLALALGAVAGSAPAGTGKARTSTDTRALPERPVPVVLTDRLSWVEPPNRIGLDGGWTVELADPLPLLQRLAVDAAAGARPLLRVVGTHRPDGGERVVRAGDLVVLPAATSAALAPRALRVAGRHLGEKSETELEGFVLSVAADGFTLDVEGVEYRVVVTSETELEGFSSLSELAVGDEVEARGDLAGNVLTATRVRLRSHGEQVTLRGSITALGSAGFTMTTGAAVYDVVVTPDTEFANVDGLAGLEVADEVDATGRLVGSTLTATEVELRSPDSGGGLGFEFKGRLVRLVPPDRFAMDDGRSYRVDDATVYDPVIGSYAGLVPDQYLEVTAVRGAGGDNLVLAIEYEGESQGGQGYVELEGTVAAVGAASIELDGGELVMILPSTLFTGDADSLADVVPGWSVEIRAQRELSGELSAREVRAEDPAPATVGGQDFEPRQALVVPAPGAAGDGIAVRFGAEVVGRVGDLAVLLWWPEPIDDALLAALTADPDVAAVEPNYLFRDPESVRRRYPTVDRSPTTLKLIEQPAVHQLRMGAAHRASDGRGIVVAVMDTGVDPLHPVLRGRLVAGGLDLVDGDASPWEARNGLDDDGDGDVDEAAGHGTFVASLIALAAPGASILPYRVLDDDGGGTAYHLAIALADAVERRVDVINLSLVYQERSTAVDLLLERAAANGTVVVTSAGNDSVETLPFPASDSHTVAVVALASDGLGLAPFSNRALLAPVAAPGEEVYGGLDEHSFGTSSGTSMAAPFVSATVALLLAADPGLDPALVRNALGQSGVPIQDGGWNGVALDMASAVSTVAGP